MKRAALYNSIPRQNNPSIQSILATSKCLLQKDDVGKKNQEESNFKDLLKTTKKQMISIILSHIDELARLVFEEPLSKVSYKTLLSNTKIQKSMIKSEEFHNIVKFIIKSEHHNTVGRLSEFIDQCLLNFPYKIGKYFPFISDLFKFCNISYSSTVYMFIDLLNINMNCQASEFWTNFLIENKYFVLNKLDDQSSFFTLPSTLYYALKDPITCDNWKFLVRLSDFPENLNDLGHLVNEAAHLIEPSIYYFNDISDEKDTQKNNNDFKIEYKEIQVHAIEFLTKMIEQNSIKELVIQPKDIINNIIEVMKKFQHHNFALKACVNFIIASINSDDLREEIISIVFPFFIDTIEKDDINERFLISFCKFCIDSIQNIDESLVESIPDSILNQCSKWSEIYQPKSDLSK